MKLISTGKVFEIMIIENVPTKRKAKQGNTNRFELIEERCRKWMKSNRRKRSRD